MSEIGDRIAEEAATWKNTPFIHQGTIKGRAVDCKNFIESVLKEVVTNVSSDNLPLLKAVESTKKWDVPNNYRRSENGFEMLRILNEYLVQVPKEARQRGDVIALCDDNCRMPYIPRHLVIIHEITPRTTYVIDATTQGVRRHRFDGRWEQRIHSIWRIRE